MLEVGDKVFINIPLQAAFLKKANAKRQYNHKHTHIVAKSGERYLLAVDNGKFEWDERVLAMLSKVEICGKNTQ